MDNERSEQLRQQMWELVYDLLDPPEVAALHSLIKSDPDVARLYSEVHLQADLVGYAAQVEDESFAVQVPEEFAHLKIRVAALQATPEEPAVSLASTKSAAKSHPGKSHGKHKSAEQISPKTYTWLATGGTLALLMLLGVGLFRPPLESEKLAHNMTVTELHGPAKMVAGLTTHLSIETAAVDGTPKSTVVEVVVLDGEGQQKFASEVHTDAQGRGAVAVPGDLITPSTQVIATAVSEQLLLPRSAPRMVRKLAELAAAPAAKAHLHPAPEPTDTYVLSNAPAGKSEGEIELAVVRIGRYSKQIVPITSAADLDAAIAQHFPEAERKSLASALPDTRDGVMQATVQLPQAPRMAMMRSSAPGIESRAMAPAMADAAPSELQAARGQSSDSQAADVPAPAPAPPAPAAIESAAAPVEGGSRSMKPQAKGLSAAPLAQAEGAMQLADGAQNLAAGNAPGTRGGEGGGGTRALPAAPVPGEVPFSAQAAIAPAEAVADNGPPNDKMSRRTAEADAAKLEQAAMAKRASTQDTIARNGAETLSPKPPSGQLRKSHPETKHAEQRVPKNRAAAMPRAFGTEIGPKESAKIILPETMIGERVSVAMVQHDARVELGEFNTDALAVPKTLEVPLPPEIDGEFALHVANARASRKSAADATEQILDRSAQQRATGDDPLVEFFVRRSSKNWQLDIENQSTKSLAAKNQPAKIESSRDTSRADNATQDQADTTNSLTFAPGEQVKLRLRVSDESGKPGPATIAVRMVEESSRGGDAVALSQMASVVQRLNFEADSQRDRMANTFAMQTEKQSASAADKATADLRKNVAEHERLEHQLEHPKQAEHDPIQANAHHQSHEQPSIQLHLAPTNDRLLASNQADVCSAACDLCSHIDEMGATRKHFTGLLLIAGSLMLGAVLVFQKLQRVAIYVPLFVVASSAAVAGLLSGVTWIALNEHDPVTLAELMREDSTAVVAMAPATEPKLGDESASSSAAIPATALAEHPQSPLAKPVDKPGIKPLLFQPALTADDKGTVEVEFTMPQGRDEYLLLIDAYGHGRVGSAQAVIKSLGTKAKTP